jgi:hypothetical protein
MLNMGMALGLWIAMVISIFLAFTLIHMTRRALPMAFHGIFGMSVFSLLNHFAILNVPLDYITFIISALGGVFGVAIVVGFSALGIPL